MSEADAAERIGIDIAELVAYEKGNMKPHLGILRQMGAVYKLPVATLAMPEVPRPSKLPSDFRTIDGRRESISPETAFAIRQARRYQEMMQDLFREEEELASRYVVPNATTNDSPKTLAARERKRFEVSVETQLSWRNDDFAFRQWREKMESFGVFVYVLEMPIDDCRGFSLRESENPVIVISKEENTDAAKLFTLLHEYCHILKNAPGISDLNNKNKMERFCNEFAAQFLMPIEALNEVLHLPQPATAIDWDFEDIRVAARKLHVSQQALALRLENAGYAPTGFFDLLRSQQEMRVKPKKPRKQRGGPPADAVRLIEVGPSYARNVLTAYERGTLHDIAAYRMLDLAPRHFQKLRDRLAARYGAARTPT